MNESQGFIGSLKSNAMGPLVSGLVVALLFGFALSFLIDGRADFWALAILGTLVAVATGTVVRLVGRRGLVDQVVAFVATVIGVNTMAVRGLADVDVPEALEDFLDISGPSFTDSLLAAYAAPVVSVGVILAGLIAVIIVGWGPRDAGVARTEELNEAERGTHSI